MGLFGEGGGLSGLFGEGFQDRLAIAGALVNGDYGAASQIKARQGLLAEKRAELEAKQQAAKAAFGALVDMGVPPDRARAMSADPGVVAQLFSKKYEDRQFGPEGGSIRDGVSGGFSSAPRWDSDNNYYGPNADSSQAPQRIIKGMKPVVTQGYGSKVYGWDSQTGFTNGAAQQGGPVRVQSKEEVDALAPGTQFIAPDGSIKVKPGGPTGLPQSGGFPGGY